LAGAWLPGQYENILRVTDLSKRLNIPLVWLVNCSGVKLPDQEKFYANRRGGGLVVGKFPLQRDCSDSEFGKFRTRCSVACCVGSIALGRQRRRMVLAVAIHHRVSQPS